ncbi:MULTISPECIES: recombinase family protein [Kordiimonas]|jgi:DNA invertase Pin-like site-specific DNA recombinase|uniref:recombinase family protein n=1 Tax=Kordiimonas TaxID=288021 RepID=UPI00257D8698|nr:recombinase family protein [Kordiimonas sp. UBA4487]
MRRGAYRDQYLIYNRKSTDEPNNQKNSLKYQREENVKFASKAGLSIASLSIGGFCTEGVIAERHSGFKENNDIAVSNSGMVQYRIARPKFKQLMQVLSRGHFKGVICLCWDRMSRNKADDTIITKLMRSGVDVRFAYAQYDDTSAGALHMDIDGMFAAHHSRVTSEKVKLANRNMRERGICTYRAPMGYLNIGKSTDKPFDPERAPLIRQMFERYAEGTMSLSDITRWANEQGLTTQPMRKRRTVEEILAEDENEPSSLQVCRPVTRTMVHRILTNPFYIGYLIGNDGAQVKSSSHKPLVSKNLFYTVQEQLGGKRTSIHYDQKIDLPFRGLVRCDGCGHVYTPYRQKGHVYLGVRCVADCPNATKNCSLSSIEKQIATLLKSLCLSEAEQEELDARASTDIALLENKRHLQLEQIERKKRKVREDLKYLRENKLTLLKTGAFDAQGLVSEENRLNASLIKLQDQEQTSDTSMAEMMKDVVRLSELLKDAYSCYISAISSEKELFVRLIFSELRLSQNTLKFSCKNGFRALESRLVTMGCPTEWLSELDRLDGIKESIMELEKLLSKC